MTLAQIMQQKSAHTITAHQAMTLADATTLLANHRIGAVPVMEDGKLAGIVSERDIIKCLADHGAAALDMPIADAMSRAVQTATPAMSVPEAMAVMTTGRFRHLPVLEDGAMVGIVSIGDIVKARLDEQAGEVESLRAYVSG